MPTTLSRRGFIGYATAIATAPVAAQSNPVMTKPVRILVGFPPGGSADLVARALAQNLTTYASTIVVDNRPGAGGRIALEALKNSEADGATLALTPASMLVLYPHIYKKLSYDPLSDFTAVAPISSAQFVLTIGPMVPASIKTLAEFITWCKANSGQAAFGSSGSGSMPHFTGVALARAANLSWTHVAYKGGAPALNDLLGGQIAANVGVLSNALVHVQSGKLRALAVSGSTRSSLLPDVPTLGEAGFKDAQASEWFGAVVPARTPPDIVQKLHAALGESLKSRSLRDAMARASFELAQAESQADFARQLRADHARWGAIVKASGFTPED